MTRSMRPRLAVTAIAAASLALSGCAKEATLGGGELIATTGDLTIVAPEPGAVFKPDSVPVKLSLTGATVLEEASTDVRSDTGHVHVTMDEKILTILAGLEFDLVEINEEPLEPGLHLLEVEFVAANHSPFSPREIEQLTFTVKR